MAKTRIAAIDIGSSSIRMTIAEVVEKRLNILEDLRQPVRLGKDSFCRGKIARSTINEAIFILKRYKKLCDEYNVTKIGTVATTAVREALNFEIFIDNIKTYTDIDVEIISSTKECRLVYKALLKTIKDDEKLDKDEYFVSIEVGAGNVEITIFNEDYIIFFKSLPLGSLKIKQIYAKYSNNERNFFKYLKIIVSNELRGLKRKIPNIKIKKLFGIGSDLEDISKILNNSTDELLPIDRNEYKKFCFKIQNYTEDELIHKLGVRYEQAETFYASNMLFLKVMFFLRIDKFHISNVSLRDGILEDMLMKEDTEKFYSRVEKQLLVTSLNIGNSLNFEEKHALKVMEFALKIFDATLEIHHLTNKEKSYLLTAAILHDVGISISARSHHKHSLYVINAQDFFYLNDNEKNIVANIARYHRRSAPKISHTEYVKLCENDKMVVIKLASILRIADSLDNSNTQVIKSIDIKIERNKVIITATVLDNPLAELYAFRSKKELFEDFFGFNIKLNILRK